VDSAANIGRQLEVVPRN